MSKNLQTLAREKKIISDVLAAPQRAPRYARKPVRLSAQVVGYGCAVITIIILVFVGIGIIVHDNSASRASSVNGQQMLSDVQRAVSRHYLLPDTEEPALATVQDQTQLTTTFLKQAKDGDKLLIYASAKIIIIYRPSIDRIVAVGPVELSTSNALK